MQLSSAVLVATLLLATPLIAGSGEARSSTPEGEMILTVSTAPGPTAGDVIFTAVMTNTTKDEVISAPRVTFKAGTGAVVRSGNEAEQRDVRMTVSSDVEKNTATVVVEYKVKDTIVFAPTITVPLQ